MIPFNKPAFSEVEIRYIKKAVNNIRCGKSTEFKQKCSNFFKKNFHIKNSILTKSCTHSLEMAAILCGIKKGDEVIMSSFTFPSSANAFILRGATPVFVDIRRDTMNMDEKLIQSAVTKKTKAILAVHYAGVACEMDEINDIAGRHKITVIEDAAQAVMSKYKGKYMGTIGDFGCYSFHETKNYTCGEGGALVIKKGKYINRAEIMSEKGTNKLKFLRGEIRRYTWVDIGSSYLLSEINAAFLYAQLEKAYEITKDRLKNWDMYFHILKPLEDRGLIELPHIPAHCEHNGHIFYIKTRGLREREMLIDDFNKKGIPALFHYIPLHTSRAGIKYGRFSGRDVYTTKESQRLLRLPLFYGIKHAEIEKITDIIFDFYGKR